VDILTSEQNPLVKRILRLQQKSRTRKKEGLFIVEGERELLRAVVNGYTITQLLLHQAQAENELTAELIASDSEKVYLKDRLFDKISLRSGSEKVMGVVKAKTHDLGQLSWDTQGLYLLAEGIEKPGNLGALLRTAAGSGIAGVLLANCQTDIYNPHCIRNSLGGVFSLPIAVATTEEIGAYLSKKKCPILAATLHPKAKPYHQLPYTPPCAIAVGNEAEGLSDQLTQLAQHQIVLPMQAPIDSLNVSVAAGILLYYALNQQKDGAHL